MRHLAARKHRGNVLIPSCSIVESLGGVEGSLAGAVLAQPVIQPLGVRDAGRDRGARREAHGQQLCSLVACASFPAGRRKVALAQGLRDCAADQNLSGRPKDLDARIHAALASPPAVAASEALGPVYGGSHGSSHAGSLIGAERLLEQLGRNPAAGNHLSHLRVGVCSVIHHVRRRDCGRVRGVAATIVQRAGIGDAARIGAATGEAGKV